MLKAFKTFTLFLALGVAAMSYSLPASADTPKDLVKIQSDGYHYYRVDRKIANAIARQQPYTIVKPYQILKKNAPASCSNEAAYKVKLLRAAGYDPLILSFNIAIAGQPKRHTTPVLPNPEGGYFIFDNNTHFLKKVDDLSDFRELTISTYEEALERAAPGVTVKQALGL